VTRIRWGGRSAPCVVLAFFPSLCQKLSQELIRRWDTRTWHDVLSYMITYLPLNYDTPVVLLNIFEVTRTYLMDVGLWKAPCVSCYYPLYEFLACTILLSVVSWFIQEALLTQRDCEHTVSRNRVKCCINVRRIAFEKACNLWMTFRIRYTILY